MKAAGIILFFMSGVMLAYKIYKVSFLRVQLLKKLLSDSEIIKNEIIYNKTPVYEALKKVSEDGILKDFYSEVLTGLKESYTVKESFEKGIEKLWCLEAADREAIIGFAGILGATDIRGQTEAFEIFKSLTEINLKEAESFKKENLKSKCAAVIFIFAAAGLIMV